jgi:hypothetical protein
VFGLVNFVVVSVASKPVCDTAAITPPTYAAANKAKHSNPTIMLFLMILHLLPVDYKCFCWVSLILLIAKFSIKIVKTKSLNSQKSYLCEKELIQKPVYTLLNINSIMKNKIIIDVRKTFSARAYSSL